MTAYYKSYYIMILFKQFGYYEATGRDTGITSIVFYQNLPVSAILVQILVNTSIPECSSICNTIRYWSLPKHEYCRYGRFWEILVIPVLQILEDSGKYWLYQYCRYLKILVNTGNTSIADTGRFWKILVISVLQILED